MEYQIEHIGFAVEASVEMAKWYQDVLGFDIKRSIGNEQQGVAFIVDRSRKTTLELFNIPEAPSFQYS